MSYFDPYAEAVVRKFSLKGTAWSSAELNHKISLMPPADYWIISRKLQSSDLIVIGPPGSISNYMNITFFQCLTDENDFIPLPALIDKNKLCFPNEWDELKKLDEYLNDMGLLSYITFRNTIITVEGKEVVSGDIRVMFQRGFSL